MKHILSSFLALLLLGAACTVDDNIAPMEPDPSGDYTLEFSAGAQDYDQPDDPATRAFLQSNNLGTNSRYLWEGNETLSLFVLDADGNIAHSNLKFTATVGSLSANKETVRFTGTIPGGKPERGSTYYAVHPYSETCTLKMDGDRHMVDVHIAPQQEYMEYGYRQLPLVASATERGGALTMDFAAMCATILVPITFTSANPAWATNIAEVQLRSNIDTPANKQNTYLCGTGGVDMKTYADKPSPSTLNYFPAECSERRVSVTIGKRAEAGTTLYPFIMTKEFLVSHIKGITIEITTHDGWRAVKTFNPQNLLTIRQNRITVLPELTIDASDFHFVRLDDNTKPSDPTKGTGTEQDPFLIETPGQLLGLDTFLDNKIIYLRHVRLETDIDIHTTTWTPILLPPRTVFNGNKHIIGGKMKEPGTSIGYGLFSYLNSTTVSDLEISADIETFAATIVGSLANYCSISTIENCIFSGNIIHTIGDPEGNMMLGGLVGDLATSNLTNCEMMGSIHVSGKVNSGVPKHIGGLVGQLSFGDNHINISKNRISGRIEAPGSTSDLCFLGALAGRGYNYTTGGTLTLSNNIFSGYIYYHTFWVYSEVFYGICLGQISEINNQNTGTIIRITP